MPVLPSLAALPGHLEPRIATQANYCVTDTVSGLEIGQTSEQPRGPL